MSRGIEFRLWCKNKNEWETDRFAIKPNGMVFDLVRMVPYNEETHILMQFTGRLDKNEKKIFESDRVIVVGTHGEPIDAVVKYSEPLTAYWLMNYKTGMSLDFLSAFNNDIEVVGTIHDK